MKVVIEKPHNFFGGMRQEVVGVMGFETRRTMFFLLGRG